MSEDTSLGRRMLALVQATLMGSFLIALTAGYAHPAWGARDVLLPVVYGWFAGGLGGVWWATTTPRRRNVVAGYFAGLVLVALAAPALHSLSVRSLYSARGASLIGYLCSLIPLVCALAGLALHEPDPGRPFGLPNDPDRLGKRRVTWLLLPWMVPPVLAIAAIVWGVAHRPGQSFDTPYGPGSHQCRTAVDCHIVYSCTHCGGCYSVAPNLAWDCDADCEVPENRRCLCVNKRCIEVNGP